MAKQIIITGANGSLGLWTAKYLMDRGFQIIMACRNLKKAKAAIETFRLLPDTGYTLATLDLSDFVSIKKFVDDLPTQEISALVCNAGMSYGGQPRYSKQGVEETFCSNYLGHFLLTNLLLRKFRIYRILFITSALHDPAIKSPFAAAVFTSVRKMAYPDTSTLTEKNFQEFYATAKLCEILFAYELDRRLNKTEKKFFINAFNPGLMALTNLGRGNNHLAERIGRYVLHFIGRLFGFGTSAKASGKLAAQHLIETHESGKYFDKNKSIPSSKDSYDLQKAKMLWDESTGLVSKYL